MKKLFIALSIIAFSGHLINAAEADTEKATNVATSASSKEALLRLLQKKDPTLTDSASLDQRLTIINNRLHKARPLAVAACKEGMAEDILFGPIVACASIFFIYKTWVNTSLGWKIAWGTPAAFGSLITGSAIFDLFIGKPSCIHRIETKELYHSDVESYLVQYPNAATNTNPTPTKAEITFIKKCFSK